MSGRASAPTSKRDDITALLSRLRGHCPGIDRAQVANALGRHRNVHLLSPDNHVADAAAIEELRRELQEVQRAVGRR